MMAMDNATKNAEELIDDLRPGPEQDPPGRHHQGAAGDHDRRRSPEAMTPRERTMSTNSTSRTRRAGRPGHRTRRRRRRSRAWRCPRSTPPSGSRAKASTRPMPVDIIVEVEQHLGEDTVRCVSMHPTDGLARGMKAVDLGGPDHGPGRRSETLGRVMNVIGEPVDHLGPIVSRKALSHPPPPAAARGAEHQAGDVRDRDQGHRPHPALPQGRQDRPVRRRRASARPSSSRSSSTTWP